MSKKVVMRMVSGRIISVLSQFPDEVRCLVEIEGSNEVFVVSGIRIIRDQEQVSNFIHQMKGRKIQAIILNKRSLSSEEAKIQIVDYL